MNRLLSLSKKISFLSALILIISSVFIPAPAFADSCGGELVDDETRQKIEDAKDGASMADKFLVGQVQNLTSIGSINSLQNLVFGNPYCVWAKDETMAPDGVFTVNEREKIINPVFKMLGSVYATVITLAIMISAMKMGFRAHTPQSRADFWEDVMYWVLSAIFLASFTQFTDILFALNTGFVQSFASLLTGPGGPGLDGASVIAGADGYSVGDILFVFLAEWILALIMNFIYIARKVVILLLMIMGAVAAISLLFAKTRYFFGVWLKELCGNIFIQSIHAVILYAFIMMSANGAGTIAKLGMLGMFIPLTGMLSRWLNLGDSSTKLGNILTLTGMAGIGGAIMLARHSGRVIRGARGTDGVTSPAGASGNVGTPGSGSLITAGGADDGVAGRISAMSQNNAIMTFGKGVAGVIGASMGAAAGVALGPGGVAMGTYIGHKIGRGTVQVGRNVTVGSAELVNAFRDRIRSDDRSLSAKREHYGRVGEAIGTMFSMGGLASGEFGRRVGHALSGVSPRRIAIEEGYPNSSNIQELEGGKSAKFIQDRDRSYIAVEDPLEESGFRRITPYGAGDLTLEKGQTRMMDIVVSRPDDYKVQTKSIEVERDSTILDHHGNPFKIKEPVAVPNHGSEISKPGSSFNFQVKSDPYILDVNNQKIKDTRFNPRNINLDAYIAHTSTPQTMSNRIADIKYNVQLKTKEFFTNSSSSRSHIETTPSIEGWMKNAESLNQKRGRGFI